MQVGQKRKAGEDLTLEKALPSKIQKLDNTQRSEIMTVSAKKEMIKKVIDEESDDEGSNNGKEKQKWKTLEHHGVTFFQAYKPHGVKVLYKVSHVGSLSFQGAPLDLTHE